jgi:hypothetical protein
VRVSGCPPAPRADSLPVQVLGNHENHSKRRRHRCRACLRTCLLRCRSETCRRGGTGAALVTPGPTGPVLRARVTATAPGERGWHAAAAAYRASRHEPSLRCRHASRVACEQPPRRRVACDNPTEPKADVIMMDGRRPTLTMRQRFVAAMAGSAVTSVIGESAHAHTAQAPPKPPRATPRQRPRLTGWLPTVTPLDVVKTRLQAVAPVVAAPRVPAAAAAAACCGDFVFCHHTATLRPSPAPPEAVRITGTLVRATRYGATRLDAARPSPGTCAACRTVWSRLPATRG